jgi:hypothetical protein
VLAFCLASVALLALVRLQGAAPFAYSPYTELLPPFDALAGIALLLLAAPALLEMSRVRNDYL